MSGSQTSTQAPVAKDPVVNAVVADAKNLPDLVKKLEVVQPDLAQSIEGKSLIASTTPWGTIAAGVVGWLVARYGLGWSPEFQALVAGFAVVAGSYGMRWISTGPIRGIFVHQQIAPTKTP